MSASASGFVPEVELRRFKDLESSFTRCRIYAEVLGGNINSGGAWTRNNGSNPIAVQRCITSAMASAGIKQMKLILLTVIYPHQRQFRNRKLGEAWVEVV
jgi:hypothetical protein